MATKGPIQYELKPKSTSAGLRWLTLTIKNTGTENLIGLDIRVNSLDGYSIQVHGTGTFIQVLKPDEEQVIPFQALVNETDWVYVSLDGWRGARIFHWESPRIRIRVDQDGATLGRHVYPICPSVRRSQEDRTRVGERARKRSLARAKRYRVDSLAPTCYNYIKKI